MNWKYPEKVKRTTRELVGQRDRHRRTYFDSYAKKKENEAKDRFTAVGRDEDGKPVQVVLSNFKRIKVSGYRVEILFGRDDLEGLSGLAFSEVDSMAKEGELPKKQVGVSTHIIRAVRLFRGIDEGYRNELAESAKLYRTLTLLNEGLRDPAMHTEEKILNAALELRNVAASLRRKSSATKGVLAPEWLMQTAGMLEGSLRHEGHERSITVWAACAKFTAARDRLGECRDREISRRIEENRMRACFVRAERDLWLLRSLLEFIESPAKARLIVISRPKDPKLEILLNASKPSFVLQELQKWHEPYLNSTVNELRMAIEQSQDKNAAQAHFTKAAEFLAATFETRASVP
jgi:mRNA-degrading endonuclease RelE of RelBE toxin-antitoxin system